MIDRGTAPVPERPREIPPEWASMCSELQSGLQGEIVEIESDRIRIEGVVARLPIGNVLRHLTITAKTPAGKEIVRYVLEHPGSDTLASNLAALLSRARDRKTSAEEVVRSVAECLQWGGSYLMRREIPETNPWLLLSMQRSVPEFEKFARDPLSMDTTFTLERTIGANHVRAVAHLFPERRYTLIHTFTYPEGESSLPPSRTFKVRCPDHFLTEPHSPMETVAALHKATWAAMETIITEGAAKAADIILNDEIDARLERGEVDPKRCHTCHVLPSGARILVEEGDSIACVKLQASSDDESASAFWRILSPLGPLLPNQSQLITAESAVGSLAEGTPSRQLEAIRTLDRIVNADADRLSPDARRIPPFSVPSVESTLGRPLSKTLFRLSRTIVRPLAPASEFPLLDLLDGFQAVYLTARNSSHKRFYPQEPDYLAFGLRDDGALKVTIKNTLRNHLDVVVSPEYFHMHESRERCIARLARLFDRQTPRAFRKLRSEMEQLALYGTHDEIASQALRSGEARFPLASNDALNRALNTAADIALVYESDASGSLSEVQTIFTPQGMCDLVLTHARTTPPIQLRMQVVHDGILSIHFSALSPSNNESHSFPFLTPISLPEGREVMTNIFRLFREPLPEGSSAALPTVTSLQGTPLFRYLQGCQARFEVQN